MFTKIVVPICLGVLLQTAASAESFRRADVKISGPIEYGQITRAIRYTGHPRFTAFSFNARPGDQLDITVTGSPGKMEAYLTNGDFESMAGGEAHFSASIPADSKPATYYVLVAEKERRPTTLKLDLERPSTTAK